MLADVKRVYLEDDNVEQDGQSCMGQNGTVALST